MQTSHRFVRKDGRQQSVPELHPRNRQPAAVRSGYSGGMSANVSIEIDKRTADVLQTRAAELGVTVSQLIAELATLDGGSREAETDEVAELDRRSASAAGGDRVPHDRGVRWL